MVFSYVAQHPPSAWGTQKQGGGGAAGRRDREPLGTTCCLHTHGHRLLSPFFSPQNKPVDALVLHRHSEHPQMPQESFPQTF